jgi:hypothetical protein
VGATNRAGLAFNGCRFGGSLERANTHSASGLDGCCGGHMGVHGVNYIEDAYKTLKLTGQNRRTSSGLVLKSQKCYK